MTRILVESARAATRLERVRSFVREQVGARELVLVGATREAARDLVRREALEHGACAGVTPTTLSELALRIARPSLVKRGETWVTGSGLDALVARALRSEPDLGRYEAIRTMPGTPRALARTLLELWAADLAPNDLLEHDAALARLAGRVDRELARHRLVASTTLLARATARLRSGEATAPAALAFLDVPLRARLEEEFARCLAESAAAVCITVPHGDARTRASWLASDAIELGDAARDEGALATRLFVDELEEGAARAEASTPAVRVVSGTTEGDECVELVRALVEEVDRGTPFDAIAIVVRDAERYRVPLSEALARARVPAYFERGTRRPDPAGRAFLALLECALDHLSARAFSEYLAFGALPATDAHGAPLASTSRGEGPDAEPTDDGETDAKTPRRNVVAGALRAPRRWERLLVEAAVVGGGPERWARRLDGLAHELELALADAEDRESPAAKGIERQKAELARLRAFALPLVEKLAALPREAPWRSLVAKLVELARASLAEPRRVIDVLEQLAPMAPSDETVELAELVWSLGASLRETVGHPVDRGGAVRVLGVDELAGRTFRAVLVPGLVERAFPRRLVEDPVLLDRAREALGASLATLASQADDERLALRRVVQAAEQTLVVSHPRRDARNRPRVPSLYLLELVRAARGELVSLRELERESRRELSLLGGAPKDPRAALDEREADLAELASLLARPASESVGRAAHLLAENAFLARSLRARARRHLPRWTSADGLVLDPVERRAAAPQATPQPPKAPSAQEHAQRELDATVTSLLAKERPEARVFSASALESFAACPYRFFLKTIVRLAPRETAEPLEALDPRTRGSLVHLAQHTFLTALRDAGLAWPGDREAAFRTLDEALDAVARQFEDQLAPAIPQVFADELERIRQDLRGWLHRLRDDDAWAPAMSELGFGQPGGSAHDARSVATPVEVALPPLVGVASPASLRLRGSIDLVERSADALRATDHKTGRKEGVPGMRVRGGQSLQPLLYALVLERLVATGALGLADRPRVEGGRLSYCTERAEFATVDVALDDAGREAVATMAHAVDRAALDAFFPRRPLEGACTYCDYAPVCGPDALVRARRKNDERSRRRDEPRVGPLDVLRGLP